MQELYRKKIFSLNFDNGACVSNTKFVSNLISSIVPVTHDGNFF